MSRSRRAREWPGLVAAARELLADLERDGPDILDGAHVPEWDGHRSVAAGFGDGRGGGRDMADRIVDRLDRIEEGDAKEMRDHLIEALRSLRRADAARSRALSPPPAPKPAARPEAPGCVNCERYEIYTVATEAGRCPECLDHWRTHDRDAPEQLVVNRPANQRRRPRLPTTDPAVLEALRRSGDAGSITPRTDTSITVDDMQLRPDRLRVMRADSDPG